MFKFISLVLTQTWILKKDQNYFEKNGLPDLPEMETNYFVVFRNRKNIITWKKTSQAEFQMLQLFKNGCTILKTCEWIEQQDISMRTQMTGNIQKFIQDWVQLDWHLIFSECIANETTHTLHYKGQMISPEILKERFQTSIKVPFQFELGGFEHNTLVSHLCFYKPRPFHPYECHTIEFGIKILKNYCSIGLGSKMLLVMEEIARNTGIKRIQAMVRTSNLLGLNFYSKHGYDLEGVKKQAVFINGVYENEFYIAKILE